MNTFGKNLLYTFVLILLRIMVSVVDVKLLFWDDTRVTHRAESKEVIDFAKKLLGFLLFKCCWKIFVFFVRNYNYNFRFSEEYATHSFPPINGPFYCIIILNLKLQLVQLHFISYDWFSFPTSTKEKQIQFIFSFYCSEIYPA